MSRDTQNREKVIEKTVDIITRRREASFGVYVILVLIYLGVNFVIGITSNSRAVISLDGGTIPVYSFSGVFASITHISS